MIFKFLKIYLKSCNEYFDLNFLHFDSDFIKRFKILLTFSIFDG